MQRTNSSQTSGSIHARQYRSARSCCSLDSWLIALHYNGSGEVGAGLLVRSALVEE
jgi:hypothetical protein